ncbi:hypothetical protein [Streptomyces scabiei]|uniref:hypothetical protein n=1 Tax=Streptomyces scabiei TaxID=1930 RepID=UPI0029A5882D|nr:hypothetical protein [Streptomyces scabiei]MDX3524613.1 hypothetical protein [Streptomyces scabiei]
MSIRRWYEQGLVLLAQDASGPLGYSVLEYSFVEQDFVTMQTVAPTAHRPSPTARRQGVGTHLQRVSWSPVGLLHGLDEGDLLLPVPKQPTTTAARCTPSPNWPRPGSTT